MPFLIGPRYTRQAGRSPGRCIPARPGRGDFRRREGWDPEGNCARTDHAGPGARRTGGCAMKTLQVQQNQGSSYLSPSRVQRGGDRLAKIHEKRTENSTQVIASQGFKFSPAILGTCQQLSARNVLRPKAFNCQFRRPYIGTADDKSELAGKPGPAPPLGRGL